MEREWKTCFKGKKILVVEDDTINQSLMEDILQGMQCEIDLATDGIQAVEKVAEHQYDLVLMDVRLPNKDGIQAAREIRNLEKGNKDTPILALTASAVENEGTILQAGMNGMISKPIDLSELREKMAKILLGES